jgi:phosphohistidine swiveling domain-containing protein
MSRYIVRLDSKSALQEVCAGGKGASLAWLRRNGFNVPSGFVITSATFADFLANFCIEVLTERRDWTQRDLERIRELLVACRISDHLAHAIGRAYRRLGGRVAIRSSMVGEDTLVTSFAGQLDTILNVRGEREVLEAVKQCWASVFNWRLWNYLTEHEALSSGTLLERFSIAVVVQRMVDTKAAGVAFSADPVTGQRCVVIEAVHGLGEALVQGLAKPDRYVVDARGVLAEAQPAGAGAPVLEENQILRLAEIVCEVASKTKDPQDIEWAWDGAKFYLLQSRPITSLVGQRVYSNRMVSDMSPGLIKPLVYSTKTVTMAQNVFGRIFTELIGPNDIDFTFLTKRIRSRIYTDITMLGDLFERVGLPANFFEMMSRDERADLRRPPLTLRTLRGVLRLVRFAWRYSRVADEIVAFLKRHDRDLEHYRQADWSSEDPQDLLAQFDKLMHLHSESQWYVFIGPMNMMVRNRLLNRLVSQWTEDVVPNDLIRGLVGLKALEPNDELRKLAAQARALGAEIQRLLIEEDDKTIRKALSTSDEGWALVRSVDAFLRHYGFLSPNGTDFTAAPWAETPTLIWHAIGRSAASPMEPVVEDVETIREEARSRVRARLNRMHRMLFDRLLASTITYIDLRERTSLLMSEDSYQMRRIFLALADHLVARGDLDQRDDIFYVTYDELRQLVEGKLEANAARRLVTTRKTEMEADAQIELPDTVCGDHVPTRPILPIEGQEYLVGISGSSGLAQGYARIVLEPVEAPVTLTKSDILVVPFTDVGWTPLFSGIGGIVAETGGQLSHTSIVAREYGLPAVVSVKKATHLVKDGQPITVDGDMGRVYLKHMMDS